MIDEIAPYYKPETIREFRRKLKFIPKDVTITEQSRALRGNVKSYEVPIVHSYDPSVQLNNTKKAIFDLLMKLLKAKRGFKFNATLNVRLSKRTENGMIYREPYFNAGPYTVINSDQISESIDNAIEIILELIAGWLSEGSGWVFELVLSHNINIVSYFPLKGKSYIKLPEELRNPKKALINPKNEDNRCFLWCHNRHLNPLKKDPQRITKADRESVKKLDYTGVTFPVTVEDMDKIEKQNSININVFGYDGEAYPIRISEANFPDHIELLWIEDKHDKKYETVTMCSSRISIDSCIHSLNTKKGNIFVCVVFIVALLLESWKTTSRIACLLMEPKRSRCLRQDQKFIFKITRKYYLYLLSFTLILKQSQKKLIVANLVMVNLTLPLIRVIRPVVTDIN